MKMDYLDKPLPDTLLSGVSGGEQTLVQVIGSVPDLKLLITDPDPLMENQEFRIRILETIQLRIRILPSDYRLIKNDTKICQHLSFYGHKWFYFIHIMFFLR